MINLQEDTLNVGFFRKKLETDMDTFIVIVTKYLFILLMLFYTWESFSALIHTKRYQAAGIFQRQNAIIFVTYILGIVTIFYEPERYNRC